jgi:hypothetical protein
MSMSREAKIWLAVTSKSKYARAATSGGWGGGVWAQAKPVHALSMQAATALKTLAFNKARREFENKLFMLKVLKIEVELRPQEQAA